MAFSPGDNSNRLLVGWREWIALPGLDIPAIKAKIDTGARTSAIHAFDIHEFEKDGIVRIRFGVHPLQGNTDLEIYSTADVLEQRIVTDSGGHREKRYVIQSVIQFGGMEWPAEFTLTDRDTMKFRMLLGRTAMRGRLIVDPQKSFLTGRTLAKHYRAEQAKKALKGKAG